MMLRISIVLALALVMGAGWGIHVIALHRRLGTWRVDPVTGLPVRQAFYRDARTALRRPGTVIALLDLDNFKLLNDTHGHIVADGVLCEIGSRLRTFFGPQAVLSRLMGDEFAIITQLGPAAGRWRDTLHRLPAKLAEPIELPGGEQVIVRASIGALHLNQTRRPNLARALHLADRLMYEAKRTRGGLICKVVEPGDPAMTDPVDDDPHQRIRHGADGTSGRIACDPPSRSELAARTAPAPRRRTRARDSLVAAPARMSPEH